MNLKLRYMRLEDVSQVVQIDRLSFSTPWSHHSYAHEVGEAAYSYMVVLETTEEKPLHGWQRWWRGLRRGGANGAHATNVIIGYGGLWSIAGEAHISTIAIAPEYRGKGYGEVLLLAMLRRAILLNASYVVLEVRVSNTVAKNLYRKYGFQYTHTKPGYYRDNHEDAEEMRVDLTPDAEEYFTQRHFDLMAEYNFTDTYTEFDRPTVRPS